MLFSLREVDVIFAFKLRLRGGFGIMRTELNLATWRLPHKTGRFVRPAGDRQRVQSLHFERLCAGNGRSGLAELCTDWHGLGSAANSLRRVSFFSS